MSYKIISKMYRNYFQRKYKKIKKKKKMSESDNVNMQSKMDYNRKQNPLPDSCFDY